MNLQKYFVGLSATFIIFTNNPQVFADEVEIFGDEFGNKTTPPAVVEKPATETPPAVVEKPATETPQTEIFNPPAETPPAVVEKPAIETPPAVVEQPAVETPPAVVEKPAVETPPVVVEQPAVETPPVVVEKPAVETPPVVVEQPAVETPPAVVEKPAVETPPAVVEKPFENQTPPQTTETFNPPVEEKTSPATISNGNDEEDFGDSLNFDDLNRQNTPNTSTENLTPNYPKRNNGSSSNTTVTVPRGNNSESQSNSSTSTAKQAKMKNLPQRFVQVAVDENYIYFLDKQSVTWKKIPYMNSEYMADVWIRMIERNPSTEDLPEDLANYVNDVNTDEITLARAKGYQYMADDLKVLRHKKYFLEHYYLRPKKDQIQFLCELEVVGHPQNTASQRKYNAQNWEDLIPGSMESILYYSIIQVIGKSKAGEKGHMTFFDMVEEYARISVR